MGLSLSSAFTPRYSLPAHNVSEIGQDLFESANIIDVETG